MPESVERRRERARVAQRRSRAQRKATLESLQTRVQVLTQALEDMTEHCLEFSDVVISAVRKDNYDFLRHKAQPFMKKILSIASAVLDEDTDDDGVDRVQDATAGTTDVDETQDSQLHEPTTSPNEETRNTMAAEHAQTLVSLVNPLQDQTMLEYASPRSVSPCLGYGMWPRLTTLQLDDDMPPPDIAKYTIITGTEVSFSMALFWNSLTLAHAALLDPSSDLLKKFFCYAMQSEPLDLILSRIHRRVAFRPAQMTSYMVKDIEDQGQVTHDLSSVLRDPSTIGGIMYEATMMDRHHSMIVDNMSRRNDDIEGYVDAAGVEDRLSSYWGIFSKSSLAPPMPGPERPRRTSNNLNDFIDTPSSPWYQSLISHLSRNSRCIGNGIGFPINIVDDLALQLRNASIVG